MPIPNAFLIDEIRATDDYMEYEMMFVKVVVPINQPQPVVSTQGTHKTTPRAHRTPTLTAASPQGKKRKQVVEGEKDVESYASKFAASILDDDVDDSGNMFEPGSHKENPEVIDDDDVNDDEHKDEKKDDVGTYEMDSLENRIEKIQTPIPTPPRSPRITYLRISTLFRN
ncbi:hypothetical protein Tco_0622782 [Tanacetum coccineum]